MAFVLSSQLIHPESSQWSVPIAAATSLCCFMFQALRFCWNHSYTRNNLYAVRWTYERTHPNVAGIWVLDPGCIDKNTKDSRGELDQKYFDGWQQSRKMRESIERDRVGVSTETSPPISSRRDHKVLLSKVQVFHTSRLVWDKWLFSPDMLIFFCGLQLSENKTKLYQN